MRTPGPWKFEASNGDDCGMIVGKTRVVCDFATDPRASDARLIEAAPDLLEFAQWILSLKTGGMIEGRAREVIDAATKD